MTIKRVNQSQPCPICQRTSSCSTDLSNGLVFCIEARDDVDGYVFRKEAGNFGVFAPDSQMRGAFKKQTRKQVLARKQPYALYLAELNTLLNKLSLNQAHKDFLLERGLTDVQIVSLGFRSIKAFQHVGASTVAGVNPYTGQWSSGSGMVIPMFNGKGQIHGFSFKPDNTSFGKYTWTSYKNKLGDSVTDAKLLVNGTRELPLTLYKGDADSSTLYICDGVLKTLLAGAKHNINILGSQGNTLTASPIQFKAVLDRYDTVVFAADSGDLANPQVVQKITAINTLFKGFKGYDMPILDWGQLLDKSVGDIDEIESFDLEIAQQKTLKAITTLVETSDIPETVLTTVEEILAKKDIKLAERNQARISRKRVLFSDKSFSYYEPGQVLEYSANSYDELMKLAYDSSYSYVIDVSPAGSGKSHLSGLIDASDWAVKPTNIWYFSKQHRKPTTTTIEDNFYEHPTKNTRLFTANDKLTPNGNPILMRDKPKGDSEAIAGNCHLADKQMEVYQAKSKVSLCSSCKFAEQCKTEVSPGEYGYLFQLQEMSENSNGKIRANIQGVNFEKNVSEFDMAIVDEYTQTLEFVETVTVSRSDFELGLFDINPIHDKVLHMLQPIADVLSGKKPSGDYGFNSDDFFNKIGTQYGLASYAVEVELLETALNDTRAKSDESLSLVFWSDLFKAFSGLHPDYSFTIGKESLTIYKRNLDLLNKLNTFSTVLFLDATSTPEDLAFYLGVGIEQILVISQEPKTYENVQIAQCVSLGGLGVKRTQDCLDKINIVREVMLERYGNSVGFIDFKRFAQPGDLHHFVDGRGSNAFQTKKVVCCFGVANTNLGSAKATFEAITGSSVNKNNSSAFNDYYLSLRRSELEQEIGRLRSIRRKDENLIFYNFSNMDITYLSDRGFTFRQIRGYELDTRLSDGKDIVLDALLNKGGIKSTKLLSLPLRVKGDSQALQKTILQTIAEHPGVIREALDLYVKQYSRLDPQYTIWKTMIEKVSPDFVLE